ncbi:MAG TPA: hypothetical protein VKB94_09675, partial [Rhizomicrobium sp.]|nr:hypothetical protein [Rhizomicrobium sp.]
MRIRHFAAHCALAAILILAAPAQSAPKETGPKDNWIGAWGFVPTPLPPGLIPASPAAVPVMIPLSADVPAPPAATTPTPPLLDNPGNVQLVPADSDPSNITLRQLVRVAVAGKRIRLRFGNEGGSEPLALAAVHVGAAGPDGSVLPGSDRIVTFDGHGATFVPASSPLLSDPVDLKVEALEKLVISIHVPGPLSRSGHSLYQYVPGVYGDQT